MFKTPKTRLELVVLFLVVYITVPFLELARLQRDLADGRFPVNADSIGLPFGLFIIVWSFAFVAIAGTSVWIWRNYIPYVPLFGFDDTRFLRSLTWTTVLLYFVADQLLCVYSDLAHLRFLEAFQGLVLVYVILCIRVLIVFKKGQSLNYFTEQSGT